MGSRSNTSSPSPPRRLLVATTNRGKFAEFRSLLRPYLPSDISLLSLADLNVQPPEETGKTFAANARLKAAHAFEITQLPTLADDSGLTVDALDGAPGIYSARWARQKDGSTSFVCAMKRVLENLASIPHHPDRGAAFVCALAFCWHLTPEPLVVEGIIRGSIADQIRGSEGFGYDPLFLPARSSSRRATQTMAELSAQQKNQLSHRANAMNNLAPHLRRIFLQPTMSEHKVDHGQ